MNHQHTQSIELSRLYEIIGSQDDLRELNLDSQGLEKLPDEIGIFQNLQVLSVYDNKTALLQHVAAIEQQEVRWHVAQMVLRLDLNGKEWSRVTEILFGYLDDRSKIVQASAMQAPADMAARDEDLLPRVVEVVEEMAETGSPAVRSRGRRLLEKLRLKQ